MSCRANGRRWTNHLGIFWKMGLAWCLLPASAQAVSAGSALINGPGPMEFVRPSVLDRARTDVQIRRIKHLLLSQQGSNDDSFQRLKQLQKAMHGKR